MFCWFSDLFCTSTVQFVHDLWFPIILFKDYWIEFFGTTLSLKFDRLVLDIPSFLHFWKHDQQHKDKTLH